VTRFIISPSEDYTKAGSERDQAAGLQLRDEGLQVWLPFAARQRSTAPRHQTLIEVTAM